MSSFRKILLIFIVAVFAVSTVSFAVSPTESAAYTVACVGDSLTIGTGSAEPWSDSYPARLMSEQGTLSLSTYSFGVYGSTVENDLPWSYTFTHCFRNSLRCDADVFLIMLGSNDVNSPTREQNFVNDYRTLLQYYCDLPQQPEVIVVLPPDLYFTQDFLQAANENISSVRETERSIAKELGLSVIDLSSLDELETHCVDGGHFDTEGYAMIADYIYNRLTRILDC